MKSDEFWRSNDCKGTSLGVPTHHFEVFFNETTHLGPRLVGSPKRWQVISPGSQMSCVQKKIQTQRIFRNALQRVNPALNDLDGFVLVLLAYLHVRCLKLLKSSSDLTYPAKKKNTIYKPVSLLSIHAPESPIKQHAAPFLSMFPKSISQGRSFFKARPKVSNLLPSDTVPLLRMGYTHIYIYIYIHIYIYYIYIYILYIYNIYIYNISGNQRVPLAIIFGRCSNIWSRNHLVIIPYQRINKGSNKGIFKEAFPYLGVISILLDHL